MRVEEMERQEKSKKKREMEWRCGVHGPFGSPDDLVERIAVFRSHPSRRNHSSAFPCLTCSSDRKFRWTVIPFTEVISHMTRLLGVFRSSLLVST